MARPTLKDVAQLAGVTTATVSYALSGKRPISEETKRRVMEAIEALDPLPDSPAKKALVDLADYIVYREK